MLRILIFLLWIVLFAFAITYFTSLDSRIIGEAFGLKFDGPSGLIVGGLCAAFLFTIYATHKIKDIIALPGKIRVRDAEANRTRGIAALTRGLEAVAVGDAADAVHHAKVARRHLDDMALTRLLSAQAAQMSGDDALAEKSFTAMLAAPETEFLGLKGLYLQALAKGDRARALEYAERAFKLRSNARWAFESVFDLGLENGAWGKTREALEQARRNGLIAAKKANRASAALLTADAYAAAIGGETETALGEVGEALKLAPGFTPAAALAAGLHEEAGRTGKAAKTIETAFTAAPHPALVKIYDRLYKDDEPEKRGSRLEKLAAKNDASREAKLLKARAHNLKAEWLEAIEALEPLLSQAPTTAEFSLLAAAIAGRDGEEAARPWLERAAAAPRDPRPGSDGSFQFTREGWARLVREYMNHERLAPPPLEEIVMGVPVEDVRLLTAPPAPESFEEEETSAPADDGESRPTTDGATKSSPAQGDATPDRESPDEDDHIHNDEEAERAAAAARGVS